MTSVDTVSKEIAYVDGLRWRRGQLLLRLGQIEAEMKNLTSAGREAGRELEAIELLLEAVGEPGAAGAISPAGLSHDGQTSGSNFFGESPDDASGVGPTARKVYERAHQVLQEAGVPLHYRVLADEIQKTVRLSGADPGATLIAHLHRAPHLFPRVGRGIYTIPELVPGDDGSTPQPLAENRRRPRVRRRTK